MMKKMLAFMLVAVWAVQVAFADDVVTKDSNKLPDAARVVLKKQFPNINISYIKIDKELFQTTYEAVLTSGVEVKFDSEGKWIEVDCKKAEVPVSFVLAPIKKYVQENFQNEPIVKIERERRGFTVELGNGLDLEFDKDGKILRMDD